jgi:5-aminopentanamidase
MMKLAKRLVGGVGVLCLIVSGSVRADDKVRLGLFTAMPIMWDLEANWRTFEQTVELYADEKPDIVVTPEAWLDGYAAASGTYNVEKFDQARFEKIAQDENTSPYIAKVRRLAEKHHLSILFGFTEKRDGKYFNTALLIDKDGRTIGRYDKTHLQNQDLHFSPGESLPGSRHMECGL